MATKKTTPKAKKVEVPTKTSTLTIRLDAPHTAEMEKVMQAVNEKTAQRTIEKLITTYRSTNRTLGDIQIELHLVSNRYERLINLLREKSEKDAEITSILNGD